MSSVLALVAISLFALMSLVVRSPAAAAATSVDLGTAATFGVLAGSAVTNTGPSVIAGSLGVSPGTAISGFPPGTVLGTIHSANATAAHAQSDLTIAYDAAAGEPTSETISSDLVGRTLTSGVYTSSSSMGLTGQLTLDAQGDPSATFVFQVGSMLTTASGSDISLTNGAQACNVYWQVGSSATLGSGSTFIGTILALTSVSAGTGATIQGRLLARNGAVTLHTNDIRVSTCATAPPSDTPSTDSPTPGGTTPGGPTAGVSAPGMPAGSTPATGRPTTGTATTHGSGGGHSGTGTPGSPGQVTKVPHGSADTGNGGSVHQVDPRLGLAGGFALLMSVVSLVWWRREVARG